MQETTRERIRITRRYLLESDLAEDSKDVLGALIDDAAAAANGAPDKLDGMSRAILALALYEVRQAIRLPEQLREAVCGATPSTVRQALPQILLRPWPWIAASVAVFSPNLPAIIAAIAKMID